MINPEDWDEDDLEIFKNFSFKCVNCGQPAVVIHELHTRSLRPKTWRNKENRVTLCYDCHEWAHKISAKKSRIILLQKIEEWNNRKDKEHG